MPILEFKDVRYAVGGRTVLDGINLDVDEGETIVLLGRSGSGKTTLLKSVNRLVDVNGGAIRFQGKPIAEWEPVRLRRSIGYVIQESGLLPHLTVQSNIELVPRLEGWPEARRRERSASLLEAVGLPSSKYAARYPRQLSGGERQRVGVARALAADPPLLLLDEPFGALDPVTRFELQGMFLGLNHDLKKTSLFVTHDIREALRVGSRIALLRHGKIDVLEKPHDFLLSQSDEARAFLETRQ